MGIFYKSKFRNMVLAVDNYFILYLVLFCIIFPCSAEKSYEKESRIEFPISGEETLAVKNTNGNIVVSSWEKDSIRIEIKKIIYANSKKEAESLYEKIEIKETKNAINISLSAKFLIEHASVDFKIYAPEKINLKLRTVNGEIEVSKMHSSVDITTSNGEISCMDIYGTIKTRAGNGNIILRNISGTISALTANGKIKCDIKNLDVNSISRVKTTNGDIEVSVPIKSEFCIYTHSSNGEVNSEIPIDTKKNDVIIKDRAKIFITSINGNIKICEL